MADLSMQSSIIVTVITYEYKVLEIGNYIHNQNIWMFLQTWTHEHTAHCQNDGEGGRKTN